MRGLHKIATILSVIFLSVSITSCAPKEPVATSTGCIVKRLEPEGALLGVMVYTDVGELYSFTFADDTKFINSEGSRIDCESIAVGDMVYVEFGGIIFESYPQRISNLYLLQVTGKADNEFLQAGLDDMNKWMVSVERV